MAAPHVAGAFALLRSFDPNASVSQLQTALACSGEPIERSGVSRNRIDMRSAYQFLKEDMKGCTKAEDASSPDWLPRHGGSSVYATMALPLRRVIAVLLAAALAMPFVAQADESEGQSLLRVIQGLESLRYEILQEQKRFRATPVPTDMNERELWQAISEDMTLTLAQIDAAINEHRQRLLEITGPVESPPPSAMPPLLPE